MTAAIGEARTDLFTCSESALPAAVGHTEINQYSFVLAIQRKDCLLNFQGSQLVGKYESLKTESFR